MIRTGRPHRFGNSVNAHPTNAANIEVLPFCRAQLTNAVECRNTWASSYANAPSKAVTCHGNSSRPNTRADHAPTSGPKDSLGTHGVTSLG
jgi:hypothetical protein